jgi:hypothetical protein
MAYFPDQTDVELAAHNGAKQCLVIDVEEIEAGITTAFLLHALREFVELLSDSAWVVDR